MQLRPSKANRRTRVRHRPYQTFLNMRQKAHAVEGKIGSEVLLLKQTKRAVMKKRMAQKLQQMGNHERESEVGKD